MKQQVVVNGHNINLDLVNIIERSEYAHIKYFEDTNTILHNNRAARRKRGKNNVN